MSSSRRGMRTATSLALLLALTCSAGVASAADFDSEFGSSNDFGDVGLMQTPTARMRPDGDLGFGVSTVRPYNQLHAFLQVLPWLETTVRYTAITNRLYAPGASQSYRDRSLDLKLRLLQEGTYWPALALGFQDAGGTGIFSGEYLVSSFHYYDFDFSAGLGWGRVGAGGGIRNPLAVISSHFDSDRTASNAGGSGVSRLFTGHDIGPFGGVRWNTPLPGLALLVEWDGNDYQHEGLGNKFRQDTPINVGFDYKPVRGVDLGLAYERGNKLMWRVAFDMNLQRTIGALKTLDTPPPAPRPVAIAKEAAPSAAVDANDTPEHKAAVAAATPAWMSPAQEQRFVLDLRSSLAAQHMTLIAADTRSETGEVLVWLHQETYRNPAVVVGRAARVLSVVAPPAVQRFTIVNVEQGVETFRATVPRKDFEDALAGKVDFDEATSKIDITGPGAGYADAKYFNATRLPSFHWDFGPGLRQDIGGPDNFVAAQAYAFVSTDVELTDHFGLSGIATFNIWNNFNEISVESNSALPHVRSDIAEYLKQGGDGITRIEADYIDSLAPNLYGRFSFGILEEMYGGVAGELLYRPYGSRWAIGIDANWVKQRGFSEQFDFRPYSTATGFLKLHYQLPFYNLLAEVSVGRYLARDYGGTFELSREFRSGVRAGAFVTKTNVSASQFGEGQFDKGLFITIPFDLFYNRSSRRSGSILFRPLERDGGQMVDDGPDLYSIVSYGEPDDFARGWLGLAH